MDDDYADQRSMPQVEHTEKEAADENHGHEGQAEMQMKDGEHQRDNQNGAHTLLRAEKPHQRTLKNTPATKFLQCGVHQI